MRAVTLTAADGTDFVVEKAVADCSGTLRRLLDGQREACAGAPDNYGGAVRLNELSARTLERVIQYLHYKWQTAGRPGPLREFHVDPADARELLQAAHQLDC